MQKSCGESEMLNEEKTERAAGLTQSLCKAFDILACFTAETPLLRITDITKRVGMTQSNVSRLVATMVAYEYLEKDEDSGCYQLGRKIISLATVALNHSVLRCQAMPELFNLEQKYGVGANLAVLDHGSMYYLAHVDSRNSPRMYTMVGNTNPLHCTAIGKVLLSAMTDEEISKVLEEKGMPAYTYNTITSPAVLMEQIDRCRRLGYSVEYGEHALNGACIAAGIRDRNGKIIAGLSMSGKFQGKSMQEHEETVAAIVIESAALISNKLGCM